MLAEGGRPSYLRDGERHALLTATVTWIQT